jgi:inositol transport system permease protein
MTQAQENIAPGSAQPVAQRISIRKLLDRFSALIFLIVLVAVFSVLRPNAFPTAVNLFNIAKQASITGIIAVGMTFVILTGGIDLSVGSVLAVSGIVAALVYKGGTSLIAGQGPATSVGVAILVSCGVGLAAGLLQGLAITRLKVPPFVVTLGGLTAFRGLTLIIGQGGPISAFDANFAWWGQGKILGDLIPIPVIIFAVVAVVAYVVLRYTQYGRYIYAVGGNPEAARLSGLNTNLLILSVYMIVGLLAGLAGFVLAARLNSAEAVAGTGYELTVIAAVVIGGTSLFGGEGSVVGTVIGSLLISVLTYGLTQMNVQSYTQQVIIGAILVFAVWFDRVTKARSR